MMSERVYHLATNLLGVSRYRKWPDLLLCSYPQKSYLEYQSVSENGVCKHAPTSQEIEIVYQSPAV